MYVGGRIALCLDQPSDQDSANFVKLLKLFRHHTSKTLRPLPFSSALLGKIESCARIVDIDVLVIAKNLRGCSAPSERVPDQFCSGLSRFHDQRCRVRLCRCLWRRCSSVCTRCFHWRLIFSVQRIILLWHSLCWLVFAHSHRWSSCL